MPQENLGEMYRRFQEHTVPIYRPKTAIAPNGLKPREATEDQLAAAKHGDPEAWAEIFGIYNDRLTRYFKGAGIRDEADDCAQGVWERTLRRLPNYQPIGVPFSHYIFTAAAHATVDHWRRLKRFRGQDLDGRVELIDRSPYSNPEDHAQIIELQEVIGEILASDKVSSDQAKAFINHHVLGNSHPDSAAEMGKKEGAVRVLAHRARNKIKDGLLQRGLVDPPNQP